MEFIDGTAVNVALPNLQCSLGCNGRASTMGSRSLRAFHIFAIADRWIAGRSIRTEKNIPLWCRIVYLRLDLVWCITGN